MLIFSVQPIGSTLVVLEIFLEKQAIYILMILKYANWIIMILGGKIHEHDYEFTVCQLSEIDN